MPRRDDEARPGVHEPKDAAAGVASVAVSAREAVRKVGPVKGPRLLLDVNQHGGFDCPGCAWPDPLGARKTFEFCENGAKAVADEATSKRVTAAFFARHPVAELRARSGRWLNEQGRLAQPVVLREGATHYTPISWDEASALMAGALRALRSPDEAVFYTSGRTSNEAAFLYQLLARRLGTNNLPDCSNMCHESSGFALTQTLGSGKGTVSLDDFAHADAIFVVGQNPGSNHPRMLATLQEAKRNGAAIVTVNPLDETGLKRFRNPQELSGLVGRGTPLADLKLRVRVNGDVALFKGLIKCLLEAEARTGGVLDRTFIERYTTGFDELAAHVGETPWETIERGCGVTRGEIEAAARIAMNAQRIICCWAMGITQHHNAVQNIREIVNFMLLRGNVGRPGAGLCPVRGHSNVQGDRTMGIWEKPGAAFLDALEREFGFAPPREHGYDTLATLRALHAGRVGVFVALGGNFMRATPDTDYTIEALSRCPLTVQISTKLNKSHVFTGRKALILPTLGRTERDEQGGVPQFVTVENSMGVIQRSQGRLRPASSQLRSEARIIAELAATVFGDDDAVAWRDLAGDYGRIRAHIARVIPGFERYNERIAADGQFVLPHPVRDERRFPTDCGLARFTVNPHDRLEVPHGRFLLTSVRSHDQFNTTVYSLNDRYRGISDSRRVLFMNAHDILAAGVAAGDLVDITSHFRGERRTVHGFCVVAYDIPRGCVASYFPETNALVPVEHYAQESHTPAYKSVVVSIAPAGAAS